MHRPQPATVQNRTTAPAVVQRIRSTYAIKLPPDEQHRLVGLVRVDAYEQKTVDNFVDKLKRTQMTFYDSSMAALLESDHWEKKTIPDPFGGSAPITMWKCPNCHQPATYQAIHRGHITSWQDELKKAGVQNLAEAVIVYNNLLNLHVECASCNTSHAFERDAEGHFTDMPAADDFGGGKAGKKKQEAFNAQYKGFNMDEYDLDDDFIDDSSTDMKTGNDDPLAAMFGI
jgi:hypothetical protein